MQPETRYAKSGDFNIAYQVVGDGPFDLVMAPGFVSHVDLYWADPNIARFLSRLASFSRLILFDKRGSGLSDPARAVPTIEERMEDLMAVMRDAGSEHAALFGLSESGPMSVLYAASYPERTRALVLYGTWARTPVDAGTSRPVDELASALDGWGDGTTLELFMPSAGGGELQRRYLGMFERAAASPAMARATIAALKGIDVQDVLPTISVPTLVVHRTGDLIPVAEGRLLAEKIPGARFIELPGIDHVPWFGDSDRVLGEIEEFLTGTRRAAEPNRVLTTVLFADIVGSTEHAAEIGDARWRAVIESFHALSRGEIEAFRGRQVSTTGDGFLATFDGPARALRCARAIAVSVRQLGVEIRAGVHTGEVEVLGDDVGGLGVHIGARICALAGPGEVVVSRTVKDLVVGSGIQFSDRGRHELKGVPGEWDIYLVADDPGSAPGPPAASQPSGAPIVDGRTESRFVRLARRSPRLARLLVGMSRRGGDSKGG